MSYYPLCFKSILMSSFHLLTGLPNSLIPSGFPTKILYLFFFSPICAPHPIHPRFVWYYHWTIWQGVQIMKFLRIQFSLASCYLFPLRFAYLPQCPVLNILILCFPLNVRNPLKTPKQIPKKVLVSCYNHLNVNKTVGFPVSVMYHSNTGLKNAHRMFLPNPIISITKI